MRRECAGGPGLFYVGSEYMAKDRARNTTAAFSFPSSMQPT
jgi:hypothetical protein